MKRYHSPSTLRMGLLALFAFALAACAPTGTAPDSDQPVSGLASVERIQIVMLESFPVQVQVVAGGNLPDGCTSIDQVTQARQANAFQITITTLRPAEALCTEALVPFEERIPLDVHGLGKGVYTVTVNGVSDTFELASDNVLPAAPASISGAVWHDLCVSGAPGQPGPATAPAGCIAGEQGGYRANGVLDAGEPGIAGVLASLRSGRCAASGEAASAVTDADGRYAFADIGAGEYCVMVDSLRAENALLLPGGWTHPFDDAGTGVMAVAVALAEGESRGGVNFGWDYQFLPMPDPTGGVDDATAQSIIAATSDYVTAQPGLSSRFEVEVNAVEGDYARVTVHSTEPQGGFGGYLKRESDAWKVLLIASGINPYDLYVLGVPLSVMPESVQAMEIEDIAAEARAYVAGVMKVAADQVQVDVQVVEAGYVRVSIVAPTGDGQMGGFGGYLKRDEGAWTVLIIGSAFNPDELEQLGVPESLWP